MRSKGYFTGKQKTAENIYGHPKSVTQFLLKLFFDVRYSY